VDPARFQHEPAYTAALLGRLEGVVYKGKDGLVVFKPTNINANAPGSAESWSGADLAITAEIRKGELSVSKAILAQAKRGGLDELPASERERLARQIVDMRRFTRSPKVILFREFGGRRLPEVVSGVRLVDRLPFRPLPLPDYFVRRVLTTLDGDTRPEFVDAVQESSLQKLHLLAQT
jgi:hypothetical protein